MSAEIYAQRGLFEGATVNTVGSYPSLGNENREMFLQLLDEHLCVTEQIGGLAREVRWRLRTLKYRAITELFKSLDQSTQQFTMFLRDKAKGLGGTLTQDASPPLRAAEGEQPASFRECFQEIHKLSRRLSVLVGNTQRYMDDAVDGADYTTANLVSEVAHRANQLISDIKVNIPSGAAFTSECRQPPRAGTWFSATEVWLHSPGNMAVTSAENYRY